MWGTVSASTPHWLFSSDIIYLYTVNWTERKYMSEYISCREYCSARLTEIIKCSIRLWENTGQMMQLFYTVIFNWRRFRMTLRRMDISFRLLPRLISPRVVLPASCLRRGEHVHLEEGYIFNLTCQILRSILEIRWSGWPVSCIFNTSWCKHGAICILVTT